VGANVGNISISQKQFSEDSFLPSRHHMHVPSTHWLKECPDGLKKEEVFGFGTVFAQGRRNLCNLCGRLETKEIFKSITDNIK